MLRWLAIAALVFSVPAQAQVFKPGKSGSSGSTSSSPKSSAKASAKKSSKKAASKKATSKKKKAPKAEDEPKVDPDYVKIIDDDDE